MKKLAILSPLFALLLIYACNKHHEEPKPDPQPEDGNYPEAIASIFVQKCATAGCHNQASYRNSGGLLLDTWEHLFDGGSNGAVIVPYNTENSPLLYFINTHTDLGLTAVPTMPLNETPLTRDEYITVRDWIANGAPDKNGNIPFASNPDTRQKIYLTQQGCDLLAVIDADKQVVMRYVKLGMDDGLIEVPHCARVSADGMYVYVSFINGQYLQKIDTRTDSVVASYRMGSGSWNVNFPTYDGTNIMVSDWQGNGSMKYMSTEPLGSMEVHINPSNTFVYPHGIASSITSDTFFITGQYGNTVYKLIYSAQSISKISLNGNAPVTGTGLNSANQLDPHEIIMTPDHSKYFTTCEHSNELRVMDAKTDTLIKVLPVGIKPQELAISQKKPYVFTTCMEDVSSINGFKGSVYVFNYNTLELVKRIDGRFYQPHGITVDDLNDKVYIASRNASQDGIAPHHSSSCAGNNGWYNVYNLNTLEPATSTRYEVTVEPYFADVRFKQ